HQAGRDIRPSIESMPRKIKPPLVVVAQSRDAETRQDPFEIVEVQHVEFAKRDASSPHLLHGRLIFVAPGVCEREPVKCIAECPEDQLSFTRDAGAPIDECAEYVKERRFRRHDQTPSTRKREIAASSISTPKPGLVGSNTDPSRSNGGSLARSSAR